MKTTILIVLLAITASSCEKLQNKKCWTCNRYVIYYIGHDKISRVDSNKGDLCGLTKSEIKREMDDQTYVKYDQNGNKTESRLWNCEPSK